MPTWLWDIFGPWWDDSDIPLPALLVLDWQLGARPHLSAIEAGVLVSCLGWGGVVREA